MFSLTPYGKHEVLSLKGGRHFCGPICTNDAIQVVKLLEGVPTIQRAIQRLHEDNPDLSHELEQLL